MRNLTLSAAALAALMVFAPAAAADGGRPRPQGQTPRQLQRPERTAMHGGQPRRQLRARRPELRRSAAARYGAPVTRRRTGTLRPPRAPYRVYAGIRFYSARPGPGYFFINALGWVLPPFPGAVWIPAHYDIGGFWVEGCWR